MNTSKLYTSNKLEILCEILCANLKEEKNIFF